MDECFTILTPLPQINLEKPMLEEIQSPFLKEGIMFTPMSPQLYRSLVDAAKKANCSDEIILLLQEAKSVFWLEIHPEKLDTTSIIFYGVPYSWLADRILERLFECMLLFGYVPKPFKRNLWFSARGSLEETELEILALLEPNWDYYESEIKNSEPEQAGYIIFSLLSCWERLSSIVRIDIYKSLFTDKKKQEFYIKAGNENIMMKTEELVKARYGPDAFIEPEKIDGLNELHGGEEKILEPGLRVSKKFSIKWFLEGFSIAFAREILKLEKRIKEPSGQRLTRSFQFFKDACRLEIPHRFASFMIVLESLFGTTSREITFQLSSRVAWFLNPEDPIERREVFKNIKDLYDIRSKIVHGDIYSISKVEECTNEIENLLREIFQKILASDNLFGLFTNKNKKLCDDYLEGLNLGVFS
jgi:hypothetical protein